MIEQSETEKFLDFVFEVRTPALTSIFVLLERIKVGIWSFGDRDGQRLLVFQMSNSFLPTRFKCGFLGLDQDFDVADVRHVVGTMSNFLKMIFNIYSY